MPRASDLRAMNCDCVIDPTRSSNPGCRTVGVVAGIPPLNLRNYPRSTAGAEWLLRGSRVRRANGDPESAVAQPALLSEAEGWLSDADATAAGEFGWARWKVLAPLPRSGRNEAAHPPTRASRRTGSSNGRR